MPSVRFWCPRNGEVNASYVNSNDPVEREEYAHLCEHRVEVLDRADARPRCRLHEIPLVQEKPDAR